MCFHYSKYVTLVVCIAVPEMGRVKVSDELVQSDIKALKSRDDSDRLAAARRLGDLGPRSVDAVPALVSAMEDVDNEVALAASAALRRIGKVGIPHLLKFMRDAQEKEKFRWYAAEALADLGPDSLPYLLQSMDNHDIAVQMMAVDALPRIGVSAAEAIPKLKVYLQQDSNLSHSASIALAQIAAFQAKPGSGISPALSVLLEALKNGPPPLRRRVVTALEFMGDKIALAAPALKEAKQDQDEEVRDNVIWLLNKLKIEH